MKKVDLAISSYKKPESLIYTVLSLKKHCEDLIDTIYINDDCSGAETTAFYQDEAFLKAIAPIKIKVRVNKKKVGFGRTLITPEMLVRRLKWLLMAIPLILKNKLYDKKDIRYQWAIESTDKKYLFIIHDDVKFSGDIIKLYLETISNNENMSIVGDLGQCWNCLDAPMCNPTLVNEGRYPHEFWPLTTSPKGNLPQFYRRECRINEWCCLIDVDIAQKIGKKYACYFGNCEDRGDTAAYWFGKIIQDGHDFYDPLPLYENRNKYYTHAWQGYSGHSVWEDQGTGIQTYNSEMIKSLLKEEFGFVL